MGLWALGFLQGFRVFSFGFWAAEFRVTADLACAALPTCWNRSYVIGSVSQYAIIVE